MFQVTINSFFDIILLILVITGLLCFLSDKRRLRKLWREKEKIEKKRWRREEKLREHV